MKGSKENYLIQLISRAKYLEPEVTEAEMVSKLAHHFGSGIQIVVITLGVKSLQAVSYTHLDVYKRQFMLSAIL